MRPRTSEEHGRAQAVMTREAPSTPLRPKQRPTRQPTLGNVYTMREVARHDKRDDGWIVVGDVVYDITNFANYHPVRGPRPPSRNNRAPPRPACTAYPRPPPRRRRDPPPRNIRVHRRGVASTRTPTEYPRPPPRRRLDPPLGLSEYFTGVAIRAGLDRGRHDVHRARDPTNPRHRLHARVLRAPHARPDPHAPVVRDRPRRAAARATNRRDASASRG